MRRRALLGAAPAALLGLTGLPFAPGRTGDRSSGAAADDDLSRQESTVTPPPEPPQSVGTVDAFDPAAITARRGVGQPSPFATHQPHNVVVMNDDPGRARPVRVIVYERPAQSVRLDEVIRLPGHAAARIELRRRSTYAIGVSTRQGDGQWLQVPRETFDCNESATNVAVRSDGSVEATVVSTTMLCRSGRLGG
jgi:hypothetical protein